MIFEALLAAVAVALTAIVGIFLFGHDKKLVGLERFVVPVAVGVFLSLILIELIPEALSASEYGGIVIAAGFILFYILSAFLHNHYHHQEAGDHCHQKSAGTLLLFGNAVHGLADGFVLGGAFLVDPAVGIAVAIGLGLHEMPQKIVTIGVLLQASYSRVHAVLLNLLSASAIVVGTLIVIVVSAYASDTAWIFTGFAAGNLLYLATSELLPRVHEKLDGYKSIWHSVIAIVVGFLLMTTLLEWTHAQFDTHLHEDEVHDEDEVHLEHEDEYDVRTQTEHAG